MVAESDVGSGIGGMSVEEPLAWVADDREAMLESGSCNDENALRFSSN